MTEEQNILIKYESDEIIEIAIALGKAQMQMDGAITDGVNPHFKSKYSTLKSVVNALKKPFGDNDLTYLQREVMCDGKPFFETMLIHKSGQWFKSMSPMCIQFKGNTMHQYGSALTYLRRFGLCIITGLAPADDISTEDDDGNNSQGAVKNSKIQFKSLTKGQIEWIQKRLNGDPDIKTIFWSELYERTPPINNYNEIPGIWFEDIMVKINSMFDGKEKKESNNV
jgi:hypothetical protein